MSTRRRRKGRQEGCPRAEIGIQRIRRGGTAGLPVARAEGRPRIVAGAAINSGEDGKEEDKDDIGAAKLLNCKCN